MNRFRNYVVCLWIFCLVTLGVVAMMAQSEIAEQRKNSGDMEKRSKSGSR